MCQLLPVVWRCQYFSSSVSQTVKMKLVNWRVLFCSSCGIVIIGDKGCWICNNTVQQNTTFGKMRRYPTLLLGLFVLPKSDLLWIETLKFKVFLPGERRLCFVHSRVFKSCHVAEQRQLSGLKQHQRYLLSLG